MGRTPQALLDRPELAPEAEHIWLWFHELSSTRQKGMDESPLDYKSIESWIRVTKTLISPWEIKAILRIDQVFLTRNSKEEDVG